MIALVDRVLAAIGLVVTAPVLGLCALGIRRASPGPVLHHATRAGLGGNPFTMLKLRTMHPVPEGVSAPAPPGAQPGTPVRVTPRDDPRVFPLGRLLRRLRIDEIPQLVNVLRGEMSLVGPRPEDPTLVHDHYDALMRETLVVPPGVTGLGSLHYLGVERGLPTDAVATERRYVSDVLPRKIALDLVYVRHRSLRYSLAILLRTGLALLGARGAFPRQTLAERSQAQAILAIGRPT